jgi:hypothetical protein
MGPILGKEEEEVIIEVYIHHNIIIVYVMYFSFTLQSNKLSSGYS